MIVRVKCEGEWNSIIILLLRRFLVLTVDQMMACLNNRDMISTFVEKIAHFL